MKRPDGYENFLLALPCAVIGMGFWRDLHIEHLHLWLFLFVALTITYLCFAVCFRAKKRVVGITLRGMLPLIALTWFAFGPEVAEFEVQRVRRGMTIAEVKKCLAHWKRGNGIVRTDLPPGVEFWYPQSSSILHYVYLSFDAKGRVTDFYPAYDY